MKSSRHATRGFTLVELMAVVAIIGVISALAVSGFMEVTKLGKVNGNASAIARMLANARTRSISERCMYVVQIAGPGWQPPAPPAGAQVIPRSVMTFRKADCSSVNGYFEAGDKLISQFIMDRETGNVLMATTPGVMPGDVMGNNAISFSWLPTNGQRQIYLDTTNTASWSLDATVLGNFTITIVPLNTAIPPPSNAVQRAIAIPVAGGAQAT